MNLAVPDLVAVFDGLTPSGAPEDGSSFAAQPMAGYPAHYVGKDSAGKPAILVGVTPDPVRARPAPIALEHLAVLHDVECRLQQPDGTVQTSRFTLVRCLGPSRALHEYFLRTVTPVIMALGLSPSQEGVIEAIRTLIELFRAMTMPPRKPVQGLWAELFVIERSSNPSRMIGAWHSTPEGRYDFCGGSQRVEVKSAAGAVRAHQFSLEQLRPPEGARVLIASLFVERSAGGPSVFDLVRLIQPRVPDHQLLSQLDQTVADTLGEDWRRAAELRFDREIAGQSLRFFEAVEIPSIGIDVPPEVTDVRFRSDLTRAREADLAAHASAGGLFRALLPRRSTRAAQP